MIYKRQKATSSKTLLSETLAHVKVKTLNFTLCVYLFLSARLWLDSRLHADLRKGQKFIGAVNLNVLVWDAKPFNVSDRLKFRKNMQPTASGFDWYKRFGKPLASSSSIRDGSFGKQIPGLGWTYCLRLQVIFSNPKMDAVVCSETSVPVH
jgi:hypothetical protein